MSQKYWLILDQPRWDWFFPSIFRKISFYPNECEYYEVCEKFAAIKEDLPRRWFISLGVGDAVDEIRLLSA